MNTDNLSALVVGVAVVALIAGFGVYFNSPDLNRLSAATGGKQQPDQFVPAVAVTGPDNATKTITTKIDDKSQFQQAPELAGISNYINTVDGGKISLAGLKGKVVLVDFWTYSCINCIRTIPYLNAWYEKYTDDGLVIVGVHTPEFEFEKDSQNVKAAVEKFGIKYPVVQDNDRKTWDAYQNRYWPHKYLVDDEGYIRFDHIGEGGYDRTEQVIQSLLQERAAHLGRPMAPAGAPVRPGAAQSVDFDRINTPELYLGYQYARLPLGNPEGFRPDQPVTYSIPGKEVEFQPNTVYLSGTWKNNPDHMELKSDAGKIVLRYSARSVNIVAGGSGTVSVLEDGRPLDRSAAGADVRAVASSAPAVAAVATIDGQRLYNLVNHQEYGEHQIQIDVAGKGFQIYTFTFG
jgi:thiol-disulfide isomerase/thioredoxin